MAQWFIGDADLQTRVQDSGDPWIAAPASVDAEINSVHKFRMRFGVINGSGTISTGEMQLEGNIEGAGWNDWVGGLAKFYEPGHTVGVVVTPGIWIEGQINFTGYNGKTVQFRVRVDWEVVAAVYSDVLTYTIPEFGVVNPASTGAYFRRVDRRPR